MTPKFKFLLIGIFIAVSFSSCYTTKVSVGNVSPDQPMTKVNSVWNHHLIAGLIPLNNAKMRADKYVGDRDRYMVETNQSFLNLLVNFVTFGIYTPTTTSYYVPLDGYDYDNSEYKGPKVTYERTVNDDVYGPKPQRRAVQNENPIDKRAVIADEIEERVIAPITGKQSVESAPAKVEQKQQKDGYRAIIYFKDGARMDGVITNQSTDDKIQIKLPSGLIIESKASDIEKIERK